MLNSENFVSYRNVPHPLPIDLPAHVVIGTIVMGNLECHEWCLCRIRIIVATTRVGTRQNHDIIRPLALAMIARVGSNRRRRERRRHAPMLDATYSVSESTPLRIAVATASVRSET